MTQLSPEAQAVFDAYCDAPCGKSRRVWVAAAIRELLEQVLPEYRPHYPSTLDERYRKVDAWVIRDQVLAIVAQLEAL